MPNFKIPKPPRSSNKTIHMPNDMIERVETAIRCTDCSFSAFVVEAVRIALADVEKSNRMDL